VPVDRLERLVNLVAALIETPRPLTRAEIRERTPGYAAEPEAFRRNFERDKDLLRQMGFPVVTEPIDPRQPDEVGYRIFREQYELPDPGLDESELTALRLAASAVQMEGDWDNDAVVRALRKLGGAVSPPAAGAEGAAGRVTGAALPADEDAAVAFTAVGERRQVRFVYRGEPRLVDPWRLSFHRGHWYLAGLDHGRGGERLFRLDRIEGPMETTGPPGAFSRPEVAQTAPPPPWRRGEGEEQQGDECVKERRPDGSVVFEVAVTNPGAMRSFVLGYLDHAEILAPPEMRAEMVAWLESIAASGRSANARNGGQP
jgi:proteasome accessory factor B